MKRFFLFAIILMLTVSASYAADELFFKSHDLRIITITDDSLDKMYAITIPDSTVNIVELKTTAEVISPIYKKTLLKWIENGGAVIIYDSRLAGIFGLIPDPLDNKEFKFSKAEEYYITLFKFNVAKANAFSVSDINAFKYYQQIQVNLLKVGDNIYSAVKDEDTDSYIPLLKVNKTSKTVAAIKKYNKGYVAFMPVITRESNDERAFKALVNEYIAGFRMPSLYSETAQGTIYYKSSSIIDCSFKDKEIDFETGTKSMTLNLLDIKEINFDTPDGLQEIKLKNGNTLKGIMAEMTVIVTVNKIDRAVSTKSISKIVFE